MRTYEGLSNGKESISAEYISSGGNTPEEFIENLKNIEAVKDSEALAQLVKITSLLVCIYFG